MIMKKIIYILTAALLAGACTSTLDPIISQINEPEEGAKVAVEFSVPTTVLTKAAMGHYSAAVYYPSRWKTGICNASHSSWSRWS